MAFRNQTVRPEVFIRENPVEASARSCAVAPPCEASGWVECEDICHSKSAYPSPLNYRILVIDPSTPEIGHFRLNRGGYQSVPIVLY